MNDIFFVLTVILQELLLVIPTLHDANPRLPIFLVITQQFFWVMVWPPFLAIPQKLIRTKSSCR